MTRAQITELFWVIDFCLACVAFCVWALSMRRAREHCEFCDSRLEPDEQMQGHCDMCASANFTWRLQ